MNGGWFHNRTISKLDGIRSSFFVNNQQHKNDISVNTHLAYLKLQLSQNVEERDS